MSQLAIKGHATRGKEVIEILEMLGGVNPSGYLGYDIRWIYIINSDGEIAWDYPSTCNYLTLEEFLEKYPYKVGNRVRIPEYESEVCISKMYWDGNEIQYEVVTDEVEWYSAKELNEFNDPNKEETMESKPNLLQQLKEYFDNTPRDVLEKEWNELSYLNEIGPTVDEYLESVKKYRQTQYPKTYEECCGVLKIPNDERYVDIDVPLDYNKLLSAFTELLICRDAYWKIAGEQMGLGKPWEPKWEIDNVKYSILVVDNEIRIGDNEEIQRLLVFPTEEMRDTFLENFKDLIEQCKKLL